MNVTYKELELITALKDFEAIKTPTQPYNFFEHNDDERYELYNSFVAALHKYDGLGISANQLGIPWSIFVWRAPDMPVAFDPKIVMWGEEIVKLEEACLSFPGLVIPVKRPKVIRARFAGLNGDVNTHTFTGMTARVFQHEVDHLEGRMWFEGCGRLHLERAIRQAKKHGFDYSHLGLMKYATKHRAHANETQASVFSITTEG